MVGLEGQGICHTYPLSLPAVGHFWSSSSIFLWRGDSWMLEQAPGAAGPGITRDHQRSLGITEDRDRSWVEPCRSDHGILVWFGLEGI